MATLPTEPLNTLHCLWLLMPGWSKEWTQQIKPVLTLGKWRLLFCRMFGKWDETQTGPSSGGSMENIHGFPSILYLLVVEGRDACGIPVQ